MKTLTQNSDEAKAKLIGNIIVGVCAIGAVIYMVAGVAMQVNHLHIFGR